MAKRYFLSKSKPNAYHQCAKRLWLEVHRKDLVEISPATQRKFDVGHQVGEVARAWPRGAAGARRRGRIRWA